MTVLAKTLIYLAIMAIGITILTILYRRDCRAVQEDLERQREELKE